MYKIMMTNVCVSQFFGWYDKLTNCFEYIQCLDVLTGDSYFWWHVWWICSHVWHVWWICSHVWHVWWICSHVWQAFTKCFGSHMRLKLKHCYKFHEMKVETNLEIGLSCRPYIVTKKCYCCIFTSAQLYFALLLLS